jgi:hypothetical protein
LEAFVVAAELLIGVDDAATALTTAAFAPAFCFFVMSSDGAVLEVDEACAAALRLACL